MKRIVAGLLAISLTGATANAWFFDGKPTGEAESGVSTTSATEETTMEEMRHVFPGAPEETLIVAAKIASGEAISAEDLSGLDGEEINRLWPNPALAKQQGAGHGLLRQAVESRNIAAIHTLIRAGADPFYNDNEWPYQAIRMFQGSQLVWFPDYSPGVELLKIWLDLGGNANANCKYWSQNPLIRAVNPSNLEGVLALLEAGADPWNRPISPLVPEYVQDSFFEGLANTTPKDNEVAFRIAQNGFYKGASREAAQGLIERYDQAARMIVGTSGTENLWIAWTMQQALPPILEQTGMAPTPAIVALLEMHIPEDIGGFYLAPDEIRSSTDIDQQARNDNQFGTERWGR